MSKRNGNGNASQQVDTLVIGGGQAGLATGYHLSKRGRPSVILDANERVGDAWRKRWDSLRLFTPAKYNGLPGYRFPAPRVSFPTKDEMADYLEDYATRFSLDVRTGVRVQSVTRNGNDRFVVSTDAGRFEADNVVAASGAHHVPKVPGFAADLDPSIVQLHSSAYTGPHQLAEGGVLLVGLGNSGAEIGLEVARTHPTWISGTPDAELPFPHGPGFARFVLPVLRFLAMHVLTRRTPIGRKVGPKLTSSTPLIRTKVKHLTAAGVEQVARVVGVRDGRPLLDDGRVLDVANVIWCTGFGLDFSWIDVDAFDDDGRPIHQRGVAERPGLYFVGLPFQFSVVSDVLPGVGRDAGYVAKHIASRPVASRGTEKVPARAARS